MAYFFWEKDIPPFTANKIQPCEEVVFGEDFIK